MRSAFPYYRSPIRFILGHQGSIVLATGGQLSEDERFGGVATGVMNHITRAMAICGYR
jgi:hypothetical protein